MIIDSNPLSSYGATYLGANNSDLDVTTYQDWLDNSVQPKVYRTLTKHNLIEIRLLVEGANLVQKDRNVSNIISACIKKPLINLIAEKGFYFDGVYESHTENFINAKASEITIVMKGQKLLPMTSRTLSGSTTIYVDGNCEIPCTITFTAIGTGEASIIINQDKAYKFNVTSGNTYTIDGINGVYKEGTQVAMNKYNAYTFPHLYAGANAIVFSSSLISNVKFEYQGRLI